MGDRDLSGYDFALPDALIAQRPAERRDGARMLVLHRETGEIEDRRFQAFPEYVNAGDAVVLNDTRVMAARLVGRREPGGGRAEAFLVERVGAGEWVALVRPGRKLRAGATAAFGDRLRAEVLAVRDDGKRVVRFTDGGAPFASAAAERAALERAGRIPLPPYIGREADAADAERYQTVFADEAGAVAAPTAGLHFSPDTLAALATRGAETVRVTLHVGYGTFEPVHADDLAEHRVAAETIRVTPDAARALRAVRAGGGRILAVGTTSTRTLESAVDAEGRFAPVSGPTELTVTPGYRFRAVDGLLTNFHLPRSSLLVLTATFGGRENVLRAYRHAVAEGYRFYSYGDCMLIV